MTTYAQKKFYSIHHFFFFFFFFVFNRIFYFFPIVKMATICAKIERIGRLETGFQQFPLVRFVRGLGGGGGKGGERVPVSHIP